MLSLQQSTLQIFLEDLGNYSNEQVAASFIVLLFCPNFSHNHLTHLLLHPVVTLWLEVLHSPEQMDVAERRCKFPTIN